MTGAAPVGTEDDRVDPGGALPGPPPAPRRGRRGGAAAALSLRLLRHGGRRAWTATGLMAAGVAVGTALLAVALGGLHGWDSRESRIGWRSANPLSVQDAPPVVGAVATVRTVPDRVLDRQLDVVDLTVLRTDAAPPPGLPRLPAAGELWVSPALAALLRELPPELLADRFGAVGRTPTGTIGAAGLRDPTELVAVRGATGPLPDALPVAGFDRSVQAFDDLQVYRQLTFVAVALMVLPAMSLLSAAARLTAARRVQQLAAVRLVGASTWQVLVVAVAEVAVVATVAAVAGVLGQQLLTPALAGIELGGSAWYPADLTPWPVAQLAVVAAVAGLTTLAAVGGVRRVVVGPLGVARRERPVGARLVRLFGVAAGVAVFVVASRAAMTGTGEAVGVVIAVAVLGLFGTVSLIGPLVVRVVGAGLVRSARSAAALLAGRRLLEDPKAAFRPVAGLTLALFVAGFLATTTASLSESRIPSVGSAELVLETARDRSSGLAGEAGALLADAGVPAEVTAEDRRLTVAPGPGVHPDRVRTALAPVVASPYARGGLLTRPERDDEDRVLFGDLDRGALVVLIGTFLLAATSAGTTAAARVLDQRDTLRKLRLAGTPLTVLNAARRIETTRPLLVNGAIAVGLGLLCASPFVSVAAVLEPAGLLLLGAVLVVGTVLVVAASAASRPLLRSVTTGRGTDE